LLAAARGMVALNLLSHSGNGRKTPACLQQAGSPSGDGAFTLPMACIEKEIEKILGPQGRLAKGLEGFEVRPSQLEMAKTIAGALDKGLNAVLEAGTGTGKTFSYLVPIILSRRKTVISTGTKNLQEQIFSKDIPLLSSLAGLNPDVVMMKGRNNYLCLHRYHQFFLQPTILQKDKESLKERFDKWMGRTEFGDLSEVSFMKESDPLWDAFTCSSEQCLGSECMFFDECFINRLRRRAAEAEIIIVNHHLFFADLKVRQSGFAEIIPRFEAALFDEAHDVEETAVTYFGESISTRQLTEFAADVEKEMAILDKNAQMRLKRATDKLRTGSEQIRKSFHGLEGKGTVEGNLLNFLHDTLRRTVLNALSVMGQVLEEFRSESFVFSGLSVRAQNLIEKIEEILRVRDDKWLVWFEQRRKTVAIHVSPLDISDQMQEHLFSRVKTVIFTSATISTNGNFDYICSRLGLGEDVLMGLYPSHFDFTRQALMYIPTDLPLPSEPQFVTQAARRISEILRRSAGRALLLFTSYQNMNLIYQSLVDTLPFAMYKQGDAPRTELLNEFKDDLHSVLFATGAFWQGVDVPGESLSCLIIDKLPFDSPGEPLVAARIKAIRARGGNPFLEYQVPSAIISLRQGLGRLIRKKTDRGIMAILDKRILTHRYGKFFLQSLPAIPITHELKDLEMFLGQEAGVGR